MLTYWDFKYVHFLNAIFLILILTSCVSKNQNHDILFELNDQCEILPSFDLNDWTLVKSTESYWEFIRTNNENEYLSINKDNEVLLGYYDRKTVRDHLLIRFIDCDTVLYYSMPRENTVNDTIFVKGYYQYLYDRKKLNSGQERFFRRNRDSLISIRGGYLKPLPETSSQLRLE